MLFSNLGAFLLGFGVSVAVISVIWWVVLDKYQRRVVYTWFDEKVLKKG
jgi:hypothetical protein